VLFDLPVLTASDRREYARFRKYLKKSGFLMMQESVYTKLVQNESAARWTVENLKKNKPPEGLVQTLTITEKQFSRIEFIVGSRSSDVIDSDERILFL